MHHPCDTVLIRLVAHSGPFVDSLSLCLMPNVTALGATQAAQQSNRAANLLFVYMIGLHYITQGYFNQSEAVCST